MTDEEKREKRRASAKAYYEAHREGMKALSKEYNKAHREERKAWRKARRLAWESWFREIGRASCSKCGYSACLAAIEEHHIDPAKKEFGVAYFLTWKCNEANKVKLLAELQKCITLCANCHREAHHSEQFKQEK